MSFINKLVSYFSSKQRTPSKSTVELVLQSPPQDEHLNLISPIPIKNWNSSLISFPEPSFLTEYDVKMTTDIGSLHRKSTYPWRKENSRKVSRRTISSEIRVPPNTPCENSEYIPLYDTMYFRHRSASCSF